MDDDPTLDRADQVRLYLHALGARMDPDQFRVLKQLVSGALAVLSSPAGEGDIEVSDEDQVHVTTEVQDELLAILSIMATGSMDHHIVDVGNGSRAAMDPAAATDERAVQRMRDWTAQQVSESERTDEVLRGIEAVSKDA